MRYNFQELLNFLRVRIVCAIFQVQKIEVGRFSYYIHDRKQGEHFNSYRTKIGIHSVFSVISF